MSLRSERSSTKLNWRSASATKENETPVIISGWLKKMRRHNSFYTPTWDKRWIVIQNGSISWRKSCREMDHHATITTKSISLNQIQDIYKIEALTQKSSKDSGKIFVVKSKKRNLCLMAMKKEECDKWVRAIQLQLDLSGGSSLTGTKCSQNRRRSMNGGAGGDKYDHMLKALNDHITSLDEIIFKNNNNNNNNRSTPKTKRETGSFKRYRKNNEYSSRLFESMRFQSPNSDASTLSDVLVRNHIPDEMVVEVQGRNEKKTMYLV